MIPAFIKLLMMIKGYLMQGLSWWQMPFVLVMLYQFQQREVLMKYNLFDSYPRAVETRKQHCNDPVVGYYHLGCYGKVTSGKRFTQSSYDNCIRHCLDVKKQPYAAYNEKNGFCRCLSSVPRHRDNSRSCCGSPCYTFFFWNQYCQRRYNVYRTLHCTERMRKARTIDGTCNDLNNPAMGSRLYRFGRNVPLNWTAEDDQMLEPNPRKIAREVLARKEFIPVKQINLLAAGWIQFMLHDWFDHGEQDHQNRIEVPLERNDPLYSHHKPSMSVSRTKPDNCNKREDQPATFQNDVTHWWDLSQIYGSDVETNKKVRSFEEGKLKIDVNGLLPVNPDTGIDITGFSNNWWVGLALMHNIFTREHNAICDMLYEIYPTLNDQELFDKARLINTAVMIKIHTIEWTPAILNNKALRTGMRVNWGLGPGKETWDWLRAQNITSNPGIKSLVGGPTKLRGVPFSLTEEFVSVYRMHPLLPDFLKIRSMETKEYTEESYSLPNYSFSNARKIFKKHSLSDILYTFGVEYPGALTLNNYPKFLTDLKLPNHQQNGETVDVSTIDILRDRERGVPRYNNFRRLMKLKPVESFENLTTNAQHVSALKKLYCNDIEKLDLLIGSLAEEPKPTGFGFGETSFNLFVLMASRRLEADRFLTKDFNSDTYTEEGMQWIKQRNMTSLLLDAFKRDIEGLPDILKNVENAFFPWN
ncbi:alpha-dioxygenase 2 [Exaiptasia diaphana]|uniref:Peroxidase n=1 Tax=Exaiptasia diaphana TaxID=2652724 RepID=A0A913X7U1_EXADI|nr:alpha-dioxygenase 2 [Exaiptasia diaphana]KXJ28522.1 Alpha-dioxygenase 2 [Exaiptasia diaphana]